MLQFFVYLIQAINQCSSHSNLQRLFKLHYNNNNNTTPKLWRHELHMESNIEKQSISAAKVGLEASRSSKKTWKNQEKNKLYILETRRHYHVSPQETFYIKSDPTNYPEIQIAYQPVIHQVECQIQS